MNTVVKSNEISLYPLQCTGCGSCEMACSMVHHGVISPALSKIDIEADHTEGTIRMRVHSDCSLCKSPVCQAFCVTGAIKITQREHASLSVG